VVSLLFEFFLDRLLVQYPSKWVKKRIVEIRNKLIHGTMLLHLRTKSRRATTCEAGSEGFYSLPADALQLPGKPPIQMDDIEEPGSLLLDHLDEQALKFRAAVWNRRHYLSPDIWKGWVPASICSWQHVTNLNSSESGFALLESPPPTRSLPVTVEHGGVCHPYGEVCDGRSREELESVFHSFVVVNDPAGYRRRRWIVAAADDDWKFER
jgi:hypothetical protein